MSLRLIIALDFAKLNEALSLVEQLDPKQCALKIGSEMFSLFGPDLVHRLVKMGFKVFLDLKFHDIPNTVAQACRACAELGVWMINLHAAGGLIMMQEARKALEPFKNERPLLIAVTVLTSMNEMDLPKIGINNSLEDQVKKLTQLAYDAGLDGVVCSAYEVPMIKETHGSTFLTITPGIRPSGDKKEDQSRVMTPIKALESGSDFLVIGRPITKATAPLAVIKSILDDMQVS